MTAPTPEQMRVLADEHAKEAHEYVLDKAEKEGRPEYGDDYEYEDRIEWHRKTAIALRTAADQLDAAFEQAALIAEEDAARTTLVDFSQFPIVQATGRRIAFNIRAAAQKHTNPERYGEKIEEVLTSWFPEYEGVGNVIADAAKEIAEVQR